MHLNKALIRNSGLQTLGPRFAGLSNCRALGLLSLALIDELSSTWTIGPSADVAAPLKIEPKTLGLPGPRTIGPTDRKELKTFVLVVLSTQLHEEMHWRFPIAQNSAFRTQMFVPLCSETCSDVRITLA